MHPMGARYLHAHDIGHRDISLENVLLKNGVTRLMDFGMAAQTRRRCGTRLRYFRAVGKDSGARGLSSEGGVVKLGKWALAA